LKRIPAILLFICLSGLILAACGTGLISTPTPTATVRVPTITPTALPGYAPMKVVIGLDASYPPFESVDYDNRKMVGFDVDLMDAIAARVGLNVEYSNVNYTMLLGEIAQCQVDGGISAITIADDLKQQMNFSDPYYNSSLVVVVKKGNTVINGPESLPGMTVGSQAGTPGEVEIQKIPGVQYTPYDNFDIAYNDLIGGMIDAVVSDKAEALSYVNIKAANLKIAGGEFNVENYGVAVCSQNEELLKRVNAGIASVRADGTLDKLVEKWITNASK
jgi:polar amino acid transport system substrate-binding protein